MKEWKAKYFSTSEFRCQCEKKQCEYSTDDQIKDRVSEKLLEVLDAIRIKMGKPLIVNSGLRCKHNIEEEKKIALGKPPGSHYHGVACDIALSNLNEIEQQQLLFHISSNSKGCDTNLPISGIGTGRSFFHIDVWKRIAYWSY